MINLHQNVFGLFFCVILLSGSVPLGSFADDITNSTDVNSNEITFDDSDTILPISIYTEKESYKNGDTIKISSLANTQLDIVSITVRNPSGNIVSYNQHAIHDGVISVSFVAGGIQYNESGKYSIEVEMGDSRGITYFYYSHDDSAKIESADVIIRNDDSFCDTKDSCFDPHTFKVAQGSSVVWYNADDSHHHIISGTPENPINLFDSELLYSGDSFEFEFADVGEHDYFDMAEPWRKGKIIVTLMNNTDSIVTNSTGTVDTIIPTNSTNITSNVIPTNSTIPIIINSTQNNQNILDNYFDSINFTKTNSNQINNSTITTNEMIQIDKNVQWTQTITLNQTSKVAIEIPDDAKDVVVINDEEIIPQVDVDIIISEQAESLVKQKTTSTGIHVVLIDEEESVLVPLDGVISVEENKDTKLAVVENIVSKNAQEIIIQYETPAPYTIEKETDGEKTYEKKIKVKSDSAIHYSNVRSHSSIPEEYVLQGIPFELDWLINGTRVNVIHDERFDVQFSDTDGNGLVDTMSWVVPQLSEKVFSINADTGTADDIPDVPSKLELMKQKMDGSFYEKTLQMVNAKVMGELDEFLIQDRELGIEDIQTLDDFEYYSIVIVVPNADDSGSDRKVILDQNKDELVKILQQHDAKNIYRAENLSFVTAQVPVYEISSLSDLGVVFRMGDGEEKTIAMTNNMNEAKIIVNSIDVYDNAPTYPYSGKGVVGSIIDGGIIDFDYVTNTVISHDNLPYGKDQTIISYLSCHTSGCHENLVRLRTDVYDKDHANAIANIIASQNDFDMEGIAPDTKILDVFYGLESSHYDPNANSYRHDYMVSNMLISLDWSLRYGADFVNLSTSPVRGCIQYDVFAILLDETVDQGVFISSALGNKDSEFILREPADVSCGYNAISVGGVDDDGIFWNDGINDRSMRGPAIFRDVLGDLSNARLKPEIVAPAKDVASFDRNTVKQQFTGTSFAAPFVSGASAILKEANPYYTPLEIKSSLMLGAKWDPAGNIDLDSRTNKALTASKYELVATSTTNTISTTLNSYGFGLLDVEKSLAYTPRHGTSSSLSLTESHIIRDTVSNGATTEKYDIVVEPEHIGKIQKIILSWLSQPRFTTELKEVPISNLDFVLRDGQNNIVATSDSQHQNNEFVVFIPQTSGTYTIQVIGTDVNTTFIQNERFTLASTIPINTGNTNSKPTIPSDAFTKPGVIRNCISLGQICDNDYYPVDIYLSGADQDGDILSFYIKTEPEYGTLSTVLKDTRISGRVIYQPDSDFPEYPTKDYFEFGVYDGKSISSTKRVEIIQHHIVPESDIKTGESEPDEIETKNPGRSKYQKTTSFDSPATESSGLWILSSVSGSLFFFASPESGVQINANVATLIDFADDQSLSGINFAAQDTYDSDFVKIGFVSSGDIPTTNFPPVARIEVSPDDTVDELTIVTLDGTASTDHETDTASLDYTWAITTNSAIDPVSLSSTDEPMITFRAPSYPTHPTQEFIVVQLTVEDEGDLSHTTSELIWIESIPENTDNPIARNDAFRIPSNSGTHSIDVLHNDHPNKNSLTVYSIETSETLGAPSISSDSKSINYTSCADCTSDSFTYTVSDGINISSLGLVTLTIGESFDAFASSRNTHEVFRFSESGSLVERFVGAREGGISSPLYLAWINDEYLYVSPNSENIYRYDVDGNPYGYSGSSSNSEIEEIRSGAINDLESDGTDLYASTSTGIIYKYDLSDNPINIWVERSTFASGIDNPSGITTDESGNVYVISDNTDILKFSSSGSSLGVFASDGDGGMSEPYDIEWYDGHLYVSSNNDDEIYRFDSSGNPYGYSQNQYNSLLTDDRDLDEPAGIHITHDGTMYVANIGDNNILSGMIPTTATEMQLSIFASGLSKPYDVTIGPAKEPNNSPSVDPITDKTVNENGSITVDITVTDPDGDDITITATKPGFATLIDNGDGTGTISFSPGYSDADTYAVTISASDGTDSGSESFNLTVNNVNRHPVLNDVTDTEITIDAGASQTISLSSSDPDSDGLTYSIVQQNNPPSFVSLQDNDDGTAQLSVAPDSDQASAVYFVTVRVADDGNPSLYDEMLFTITVNVIVACGIDIQSSNISFGTIDPGATSAEQTLSITNTGNTEGTVSISAAPWVDDADVTQMGSNATRIATASGTYDSKVPLSESAQNLGVVPEQGIVNLFLQLHTDLIDSLFSGGLSQEMDVNLVC